MTTKQTTKQTPKQTTKQATKQTTKRQATAKRAAAKRGADERAASEREAYERATTKRAGRLLTWAEVQRTHRIRNGVYQRGGRLVSLLTDFGLLNPCYPDRRDETDPRTIHYTGAGRHGDQHLTPPNRALLAAVETGHSVPLFNKLAPGRWQYTGRWRVTAARHEFDPAENRMLWRFTLKKV